MIAVECKHLKSDVTNLKISILNLFRSNVRHGSHVSVFIFMMKGEFDSKLQWPFKGEITVELVNHKQGGIKCVRKLVEQRDHDFLQQVTKGERGRIGWCYEEFISHSDLYKPEESIW